MHYQPGVKTPSGYLATPESGSGPGVLVLHAWWGLNDFFVKLCDRLAREGFVALAPDLYGGVVAATIEEAKEIQKRAEGDANAQAATGACVLAAADALQKLPAVQGDKIGVLGCSMGVWWGLKLTEQRPGTIAAASFFYGAGEADFSIARSAYQIHYAENDEWESLDDTRQVAAEMQAAGRTVELHIYPGVGHWFFESDRSDAYDAQAAEQAWERTIVFLDAHLRPNDNGQQITRPARR